MTSKEKLASREGVSAEWIKIRKRNIVLRDGKVAIETDYGILSPGIKSLIDSYFLDERITCEKEKTGVRCATLCAVQSGSLHSDTYCRTATATTISERLRGTWSDEIQRFRQKQRRVIDCPTPACFRGIEFLQWCNVIHARPRIVEDVSLWVVTLHNRPGLELGDSLVTFCKSVEPDAHGSGAIARQLKFLRCWIRWFPDRRLFCRGIGDPDTKAQPDVIHPSLDPWFKPQVSPAS